MSQPATLTSDSASRTSSRVSWQSPFASTHSRNLLRSYPVRFSAATGRFLIPATSRTLTAADAFELEANVRSVLTSKSTDSRTVMRTARISSPVAEPCSAGDLTSGPILVTVTTGAVRPVDALCTRAIGGLVVAGAHLVHGGAVALGYPVRPDAVKSVTTAVDGGSVCRRGDGQSAR